MNTQLESKTEHPFLQSLSPDHLEIILQNARQKEFSPGEIILKQGEPANRFFLIKSGKVAIDAGARSAEIIQTLGAGEVLGWSWLFPPFCWHFTARALEPTKCVVLDGGHLLVTAEENHEFGYNLMRGVAQVVIARLQAARQKNLELCAARKRESAPASR